MPLVFREMGAGRGAFFHVIYWADDSAHERLRALCTSNRSHLCRGFAEASDRVITAWTAELSLDEGLSSQYEKLIYESDNHDDHNDIAQPL
jgi:hypothetical protein